MVCLCRDVRDAATALGLIEIAVLERIGHEIDRGKRSLYLMGNIREHVGHIGILFDFAGILFLQRRSELVDLTS